MIGSLELFDNWKSYGPIKCAAWQWKNIDEPVNIEAHIVIGFSHAECLRKMIKAGAKTSCNRNKSFELQGFITTDDHLVDRGVAYAIAKMHHQLKPEGLEIMEGRESPKLYSEFCNFAEEN